MEQRSELVALDWIQPGTHLLRLAFDDLDLIPMICADLVQTFDDGVDTAVHRVRAALQAEGGQKPVLVTGSLLQTEPSNPNWTVAIDGWLNHATLGRDVLVALANVAVDTPLRKEEHDCWRSLTGVFGRMNVAPKGQANLRVTRGVAPPGFRGAVVRTTSPYVAAGPLAWPPYLPTGDQFFWHAAMGAALVGAGVAAPMGQAPDIEVTELSRFTRRIPVEEDWCPCVQTGLEAIRAHVASGVTPKAAEVMKALLNGVGSSVVCRADDVAEEPNGQALTQGLHSLATLVAETQHFDWRTAPEQTGQLVLSGANANILVWRDPNASSRQMRHALGAWAKQPLEHPHLVVIGAGPHGQLAEGYIEGHPRDDIEAGPDSDAQLDVGGGLKDESKDITDRKFLRDVTCVRLERVTQLYAEYDAEQEAERMAQFVEHLVQAAQAA
ncbi:MAG: hypothetical protein DI570_02655 [Phenylobacterium zucineum]|nr:MAG: hypothetical protein DI570_02655 [Phenylobacterium zucineum]